MKKLTTLLVAMLFTAGMAFAQNNNVAEQVQNSTGSTGSEAFIEQVGSWNDAYQEQGRASDAYAKQVGNRNESDQSSTKGQADLDVLQVGNDNRALQEGTNNTVRMDITQRGNDNFGRQESSARTSNATLVQVGNDNISRQFNFSSDNTRGNVMSVEQRGNSNTAYQSQNGPDSGSASTSSSGIIFSDGNLNFAKQVQEDGSNTAAISQFGNSNSAVQTQLGGDNSATIIQR